MESALTTDIMAQARENLEQFRAMFSQYSPEQLNWKPSPNEWSIAQCAEHLVIADKGMMANIEQTLNGTAPIRWMHRLPGVAALLGKILYSTMNKEPKGMNKLPTPPAFQPAKSAIRADVLEQFAGYTKQIERAYGRMKELKAEQQLVISPFNDNLAYSLESAISITVAHQSRHLRQALRVAANAGFPR